MTTGTAGSSSRPDGRAVPACGYRPEDVTDDGFGAAEEYFDGASAEVAEVAGGVSAEVSRSAPAKAPTHSRSISAEHQAPRSSPH